MTALQYYLSAAVAFVLLGAAAYVMFAHSGPAFWSGALFVVLAVAGVVAATPWVFAVWLLMVARN